MPASLLKSQFEALEPPKSPEEDVFVISLDESEAVAQVAASVSSWVYNAAGAT